MKKLIVFVLALICIFGLIACKPSNFPPASDPDVDLNASFRECRYGTITAIFTEGGGADTAEVIQLEIKDHDSMYFTIVEDTEFSRYYSDTENAEPITKNDLYIGAYVAIHCESYHRSEYHPILKIEIIEPTAGDQAHINQSFDIAVSYVGWIDSDKIYSNALNHNQTINGRTRHFPIYKFNTAAELEQFKTAFDADVSMNATYNEMPSFNDTCAKYDAEFFNENTLILIYVEAESGSFRFGVDDISCNEHLFCVHVKQINAPEDVTCDMAGWFITIAVPDAAITDDTEFDADSVHASN